MKHTSIILASYLFIGSLIPRIDFSQLLHLEYLVDHYQFHKEEARQLERSFSISEFISLHFFCSGDEHQHLNKSAHKDLPLHSFGSTYLFFCIETEFILLVKYPSSFARALEYLNRFHLKGFVSISPLPPPYFLSSFIRQINLTYFYISYF